MPTNAAATLPCPGSGKLCVPGTQRKDWAYWSGECPDCGLRMQIGHYTQPGVVFGHLVQPPTPLMRNRD